MILASMTERDHKFTSAVSMTEGPRRAGLSKAEELGLAARIADGDREARNRLVQANLALVFAIARKYTGRGLALDDLVGEGNLGLIRAADGFNPRFGTRFSTYASYWIKESILKALTNTSSTIRIPFHMVKLLTRWRRAALALRRERGQEPTFDEVASAMGLTRVQKDLVAKAGLAKNVRLEGGRARGPECGSAEELLICCESPGAAIEADDDRHALARRMDRLDSQERAILALRFGLEGELPMTLKQIGGRLGVTSEWVRQVIDRAKRKLDENPDRSRRGRAGTGRSPGMPPLPSAPPETAATPAPSRPERGVPGHSRPGGHTPRVRMNTARPARITGPALSCN